MIIYINFMTRYTSILFFLLCFSKVSTADTIQVAVASNFIATMKELIAKFEINSEHKIKLSTGSSGKIFAQIAQGAPYDVFFSADQSKPEKLATLGFGINESRFTYAKGKLVLWSNKDDYEVSKSVLLAGNYKKIALANPRLAPYGMAAKDVINHFNITNKTKNKLIQGENISQVYQFIETKNVDLGFVALSQMKSSQNSGKQNYWLIPQHIYTPIKQDLIVLRRTKKMSIVNEFVTFIKSQEGKDIIKHYGYDV